MIPEVVFRQILINLSTLSVTAAILLRTKFKISTRIIISDLLASKFVLMKLVDDEVDSLKEIQPKTKSVAVLKIIKSSDFWTKLVKLVKTIQYPANIIGKKLFFCKKYSSFANCDIF
jgi:hypothetical protein